MEAPKVSKATYQICNAATMSDGRMQKIVKVAKSQHIFDTGSDLNLMCLKDYLNLGAPNFTRVTKNIEI